MKVQYRSIALIGPVRAIAGRAKQMDVELHAPIERIERDGDTVYVYNPTNYPHGPYEIPWHAVLGAEPLPAPKKEEPAPRPARKKLDDLVTDERLLK